MKKYIIFLLLLVTISCHKNEDTIVTYSKNLEKYNILFNRTFQEFKTYRKLIHLCFHNDKDLDKVCGVAYFLDGNKKNIVGNFLCNKQTFHNSRDFHIISDSLFKIFCDNHIVNYYSDSTLVQIVTSMQDSTYEQLKQADNNFYDKENYITKYDSYYYALLYVYDNSINSDRFNQIAKLHTINKINDHWYYYRTFEFGYTFEELKNGR